jgi:signal transduction histidine kinase/CheY-like chemotaxis protein
VRTWLSEPYELRGIEYVHDTPTGTRTVRWAVRKVLPAQGEVEFHAIGMDVTTERRTEAEHRAMERKLVEAQRLEALGVLAGGVAHDFNNILTGILGHTELAATTLPADHPARPHLETAVAGAGRASALTRQLLAYAGKGRYVPQPISLNDLIRQTVELLRLSVPKKVEVQLELPAALPNVIADEAQLQQMVMNLVINGGEAIGETSGTVTIATGVREVGPDEIHGTPPGGLPSPGRYVVLTVSDTGCGMDETTRKRLFDPFFTTKFAGRGLGLSAVLGIVRSHNGGIRVDSRPGLGSKFTVLLPAAPAGTSVPAKLAQMTPGPQPPLPDPGSRGLALVADDEPSVRRIGMLMLQQLGFEVLEAENGRQALDVFTARADEIRLVLLDMTMPVLDGAETLAAIRRTHPTMPVILCSGYTQETLPDPLADSPATTFLRKPYLRGELRRAVTAVGA